jgi:hypothetical protein
MFDVFFCASLLFSFASLASAREPYFFFCFAKRKSKQKEKAILRQLLRCLKRALRLFRTALFSWVALVFSAYRLLLLGLCGLFGVCS